MNKPRYNRISIVLDELGIDQKDLARLVGVTKDTVSRWCRNENNPRLPDLNKIARVLRIDIRRLIEPTSWENETSPSALDILKLEKEKEGTGKTRHSAGSTKSTRKRK
jgi:transcriptional regulator with XRE-family HTH domain